MRIVDFQLTTLSKRLAARRLQLAVTPAAKALFARQGFNPPSVPGR